MSPNFGLFSEESVTPEILATFTVSVVNMARANENYLKPVDGREQFKPSFETSFLQLRSEINTYSNLINRSVFFNDNNYTKLLKALVDTSQRICITDTVLYCIIVYIDKILSKHQKYQFDLTNLAIIVFSFLDIAQRTHTDSFWTLQSHERITGIPATFMKKIELQLLNDIEWDLTVSEDDYAFVSEKISLLSRHVAPGLQLFIPVDLPHSMALTQDPTLSPALITQQISSPYSMHGQYRDIYTFQQ